jgi:hypothetical protein
LACLIASRLPSSVRQTPMPFNSSQVATKGVHHRRGRSFRKVGQPTCRPLKTVGLEKDGQKNISSRCGGLRVVYPEAWRHHTKLRSVACGSVAAIRSKSAGAFYVSTTHRGSLAGSGTEAAIVVLVPTSLNCGLSPFRARRRPSNCRLVDPNDTILTLSRCLAGDIGFQPL